MMAFLPLLLRYWQYGVMGLLAVVIGVQTARLGHAKGDLAHVRTALSSLRAAEAAAAKHAGEVAAQQAHVTTTVQAAAVRIQRVIEYRTQTLTKEIPVVIPAEVDRRFPLPNGLVRVYDASARGVDLSAVANPSGGADDAPSAVVASEAGRVFVANNGECLADQARLKGWQDWWAGVSGVH